jgi:hypothetical protein
MVVNILLWEYVKGQNDPSHPKHKEKSKLEIPANVLQKFGEVTNE